VRILTYKQEVGGSSPSPPTTKHLQIDISTPFSAGSRVAGNKQLVAQALESRPQVAGGAAGRRERKAATAAELPFADATL
jgi:hypothetical protein